MKWTRNQLKELAEVLDIRVGIRKNEEILAEITEKLAALDVRETVKEVLPLPAGTIPYSTNIQRNKYQR